jgi:hypothetical protein
MNGYIKKVREISKKLKMHFKVLEKQEQAKPKISR